MAAALRPHALDVSTPPAGAGALEVLIIGTYECPACEQLHGRLDEAARSAGGAVRVSYVHAPSPAHKRGRLAAAAARCAARQGKASEMHDALMTHAGEWAEGDDPRPLWRSQFAGMGGDVARFDACLDDPAIAGDVRAAVAVAESLRVESIPVILVGDTLVQPIHSFAEVVRYVALRAAPASAHP